MKHTPFLPRKKADVTAPAVDRANWTRADYVAEARERQRGAGFASPFLSVTDEQLAQADMMIGYRLDKVAQAAHRAEFQAKWAVIAAAEKVS